MLELFIDNLDPKNKDFVYGWKGKYSNLYGYVFLQGIWGVSILLFIIIFYTSYDQKFILGIIIGILAVIFILVTLYFMFFKNFLPVRFMYASYSQGSKRTYKGYKAKIWGFYYIALTMILTLALLSKVLK